MKTLVLLLLLLALLATPTLAMDDWVVNQATVSVSAFLFNSGKRSFYIFNSGPVDVYIQFWKPGENPVANAGSGLRIPAGQTFSRTAAYPSTFIGVSVTTVSGTSNVDMLAGEF